MTQIEEVAQITLDATTGRGVLPVGDVLDLAPAGWATIHANVDQNVTIAGTTDPSVIFLEGGSQPSGDDWVTTWDVSTAEDGSHQRVRAINRTQEFTVAGAAEVRRGSEVLTNPITIPGGQTLTFVHSIFPSSNVSRATVERYAQLYTSNRDDGTPFQNGDLATTTLAEGSFLPGIYILQNGLWNQFTGSSGPRRVVNILQGSGGIDDEAEFVQSLGSINMLNDFNLERLFDAANSAQAGDLIYVAGVPYRMAEGATDARMSASWEVDRNPVDTVYVPASASSSPLAHAAIAGQFEVVSQSIGSKDLWPAILAADTESINIQSREIPPSIVYLMGGTQPDGTDWVTTWDVSLDGSNGRHIIVKALGRDQQLRIFGADEIADGPTSPVGFISIAANQSVTLVVSEFPSASTPVATVGAFAQLFTLTQREDGSPLEDGDIARTENDEGPFPAGLYQRNGNNWVQFAGSTGPRKVVTVLRGGGGAATVDTVYEAGSTSQNPLTHEAISGQISAIETRLSGQRPESSAVTWNDLPQALQAGERFTQARTEDGAEWLFLVPPEIDGQEKGAVWNAVEEARYTAVGVPPAGTTDRYIDNIRLYLRSGGSTYRSAITITFYDYDGNPYPASRFVYSGTFVTWAGSYPNIVRNRTAFNGTVGLPYNKQGLAYFYWNGGETSMNGLSRITFTNVVSANSNSAVQITFVNAPEAVSFSSLGSITPTRFTSRPYDLSDVVAKADANTVGIDANAQAIEVVRDANKFIPIPAEGITLNSQYFTTADATFLDVVPEQLGETVFIANDGLDPITLNQPTGVQFFTEQGVRADTFVVQSGETTGFRLVQAGADLLLREFPNEPKVTVDDTFPLTGNTSENPVQSQLVAAEFQNYRRLAPATNAQLGTDYAATKDLRLQDLVYTDVGKASVIVNEGTDPIVVTPGRFAALQGQIVFGDDLTPTGDFRDTVTLQPGDRLRVELKRDESSGHYIAGEFLEPAFAKEIRDQISAPISPVATIDDLPPFGETRNGSEVWVYGGEFPGKYLAIGPVGAEFASRWRRVIEL